MTAASYYNKIAESTLNNHDTRIATDLRGGREAGTGALQGQEGLQTTDTRDDSRGAEGSGSRDEGGTAEPAAPDNNTAAAEPRQPEGVSDEQAEGNIAAQETERDNTLQRPVSSGLSEGRAGTAQESGDRVDIGSLSQGLAPERLGDFERGSRAEQEAVGNQIIENGINEGRFTPNQAASIGQGLRDLERRGTEDEWRDVEARIGRIEGLLRRHDAEMVGAVPAQRDGRRDRRHNLLGSVVSTEDGGVQGLSGLPQDGENREGKLLVDGVSGYSITPKQYTTKRGRVLDMQLVTFNHELSKEELAAAKELPSGESVVYIDEPDNHTPHSKATFCTLQYRNRSYNDTRISLLVLQMVSPHDRQMRRYGKSHFQSSALLFYTVVSRHVCYRGH